MRVLFPFNKASSEMRSRAGPLPKDMPSSLKVLILNGNKFTGGIPTEWVSLTNLETLNVGDCGLDGTCVVRVYPAPQP